MAKMYRSCVTNNDKNLGMGGNAVLCFSIRPIDGDQSPSAYLKSCKVSIQTKNQNDAPASYMIYASSNDSFDDTDVITAGATPHGGGTVWLNLKRSIKSSDEEVSRSDGPIYILIRASDMANIRDCETNIVLETWGRFLNPGAH